MSLSLVILAAGCSTRYGRLKQLEPVGPGGEALCEYCIHDALRAGFRRVVLVIRHEIETTFRVHLEARWRGMDLRYAYQEPTQLPPRVSAAAPRVKPWGTAHAVLAAEPLVDGMFAVCNADDFYGADAYGGLAAHLRGAAATGEHAVVGYGLAGTLSPHGGVSRGLCETDAAGRLTRIREILEARAERGAVVGRDGTGAPLTLPHDAVISMNLWGFTPAIFPALRERFAAFLDLRGGDPQAEFLISTAVNELVAAGRVVLRVLPTAETWMGVTYPDDRPGVVARLDALTRAGRYPQPLAAPSGAGQVRD